MYLSAYINVCMLIFTYLCVDIYLKVNKIEEQKRNIVFFTGLWSSVKFHDFFQLSFILLPAALHFSLLSVRRVLNFVLTYLTSLSYLYWRHELATNQTNWTLGNSSLKYFFFFSFLLFFFFFPTFSSISITSLAYHTTRDLFIYNFTIYIYHINSFDEISYLLFNIIKKFKVCDENNCFNYFYYNYSDNGFTNWSEC